MRQYTDKWMNYSLYPVFQKIVRLGLQGPEVLGYEATIRGKTSTNKGVTPAKMFRQAALNKNLAELDRIARTVSAHEAIHVIGDSKIFLNVHGDAFRQTAFLSDLQHVPVHTSQVVLEICEQDRLDITKSINQELDSLRNKGVEIAIDDFGAGFSNFWLVEAIRPDYIKLDRALIQNVDTSLAAQRVIAGLVAFSEITGTVLIAEGIERQEQLNTLIELGVQYGQGFFLGTPYPSPKKEVSNI